ncbi:MAG: ribokinase [Rhodobacteraceae bacterium]|nr:MAG: ribokinase [Paracoccaceae bacterium]
MSRVIVLGALHYDVVVDAPRLPDVDETLPGSGVDYRFGGKGGNQAVAAARMGADVAMAGRVGRDAAAGVILGVLDAAGVDRSEVAEVDAASGMSVAISLPSGEYGAVIVSGANGENDGRVADGPPPRVALIQNEIPEAANVAFAAGLDGGCRVVLNAAPARDLAPELAARVDVLIVNRIEAEALSGAGDPEATAVRLERAVRGAVVLTLGAGGAILVEDGAVSHHPAHHIEPVSAHGAGDMFTGALAARLAEGDSLSDAVVFAQAAAAMFVSSPVAERGTVTKDAVAVFLAALNGG